MRKTVRRAERLHQTAELHESCLWCRTRIDQCESLCDLILDLPDLCPSCSDLLRPLHMTGRLQKKKIRILYALADEIEPLIRRVFYLKDPACAGLFLQPYPDLIRHLKFRTLRLEDDLDQLDASMIKKLLHQRRPCLEDPLSAHAPSRRGCIAVRIRAKDETSLKELISDPDVTEIIVLFGGRRLRETIRNAGIPGWIRSLVSSPARFD